MPTNTAPTTLTDAAQSPTPPNGLPRRAMLAGTAAGAGAVAFGPRAAAGSNAATDPTLAAKAAKRRVRHFQHGVASGDPLPEAVLIWTRVTPHRKATPGSGKGPRVSVRWEVARDKKFRKIVRRGTFATSASRDHTVKVDVRGLEPEKWYYYRFVFRGQKSPVGRTRTAPAKHSVPDHLRFGVVSCTNLQAGYFTAYRALAQRTDLHAVLHLGDYLYEYAPGEYGYGNANVDVRPHDPPHEMVSLSDYRRRHAQYKSDPDLMALHRAYPWIITWDDHEVTNDQWKSGAENHQSDEGNYLKRRARAHRAYDEWMPVRMDGTARLRDGDRLFRRLRFGRLAEISMLDLRTYRSEQVNTAFPTPVPAAESEISDPDRSITGERQMAWLKQSLSRRDQQWKIIGNPVMIAPVTFAAVPDEVLAPINDVTGLLPDQGLPYNVDQWDGYTHDRREVFTHIKNHQIDGALFVTGDIHSGWACDLPFNRGSYPLGGSAGVEFVCSSITSNNLKDLLGAPRRTASIPVEQTILANNPHIKYLNFDDHGFSVLDITSKRAQFDWFIIGDRAEQNTSVTWTKSMATTAGSNTVHEVNKPVGA
ncbi:alkaline phosphatase [Nocardioides sp.]|uniref:alkaline phosphatase D family protein n=1 Tax=Nocardioides sp. TaxID=35761 RepID=UPI00356A05DD